MVLERNNAKGRLTSGVNPSTPRIEFTVADFPDPVSPVTAIRITFSYLISWSSSIRSLRYSNSASVLLSPEFLRNSLKTERVCWAIFSESWNPGWYIGSRGRFCESGSYCGTTSSSSLSLSLSLFFSSSSSSGSISMAKQELVLISLISQELYLYVWSLQKTHEADSDTLNGMRPFQPLRLSQCLEVSGDSSMQALAMALVMRLGSVIRTSHHLARIGSSLNLLLSDSEGFPCLCVGADGIDSHDPYVGFSIMVRRQVVVL
jgi:hypothetical protein